MKNNLQPGSRRDFIKNTGKAAAASSLLASTAPRVHAAENNSIRVVLIGCGGRGTGAALNCLSVENGPTLVGLADVFDKNLNSTYASLSGNKDVGSKVSVPEENKFIGFDAYKKVMDLLEPGDVVILATPPAFRWVHFTYAVEKGLNVFMEKPVTIDAPPQSVRVRARPTGSDAASPTGGPSEATSGRSSSSVSRSSSIGGSGRTAALTPPLM